MPNIQVIQDLPEIAFARDNAVIKLKSDYLVQELPPVAVHFELYDVVNAGKGMEIWVNGIPIFWVGVGRSDDLTGAFYEVFVAEDLDYFDEDIVAQRIVATLKNNPNYMAVSQHVNISYDGNQGFKIEAKNTSVSIVCYNYFYTDHNGLQCHIPDSLGMTVLSGVNWAGGYYLLNLFQNIHFPVVGAKFQIGIEVNNEVTWENYYADKDGTATVDVAEILLDYIAPISPYLYKQNIWLITEVLNYRLWLRLKDGNIFYGEQIKEALAIDASNPYKGLMVNGNEANWLYHKISEGEISWLTLRPSNCYFHKNETCFWLSLLIQRKTDATATTSMGARLEWKGRPDIKIVARYKDGTTQSNITLSHGHHHSTHTQGVKIHYGVLYNSLNQSWDNLLSLNIMAEDSLDDNLTSDSITLLIDHRSYTKTKEFLFKNRFGVFENLFCTGGSETFADVKNEIISVQKPYNHSSDKGDIAVHKQSAIEKNKVFIGYKDKSYAPYLRDFLNSEEIFELVGNKIYGVILDKGKSKLIDDKENFVSAEFSYRYNFNQ